MELGKVAENKVINTQPEQYKITCGTFKARTEALQKAAEARKAGIHVSLVIEKTEYTLLYARDMTKTEAEAAKETIEAKKVNAEISEQ